MLFIDKLKINLFKDVTVLLNQKYGLDRFI
jgi:hypothetical protein